MCETEAEAVLNTQQHILDGRPIRVNAAFEDGDKTPHYKLVLNQINYFFVNFFAKKNRILV